MTTGETNLARILADLRVSRRGDFVFGVFDSVPDDVEVFATIRETEGLTVVLDAACAPEVGLADAPVFTCLTVTVHSALESVGLTRALSTVLADAQIPCNVIAGYFHDHLLVPAARAEEAEELLSALRSSAQPLS